MKIPKFAVKRPVTTIMMMLLVLLLGFTSLTGLKLDLMPNINPPVVAVMTTYPGAGPEEVAEMVTKPLEEVIGTSSGLSMLQSRSSSNSSLIIAQYEWGADISEVREDLSTTIGLVQLPDGVERPMLVKFDPTMMPIMQFAITSGEDLTELQELVDEVVVPQLQNIDGVASVSVVGGFEEEISVRLDEEKLIKNGLTQEQIVQLIQANNLTFPGGMIEENGEKLSLRVLAKVESIDMLKDLPVSIQPSETELEVVRLEDVAVVELAPVDSSSVARLNGAESLLISVQKEGTANTVQVSNRVQDRIESLQENHPNINISVAMDQGDIINQSVSNVSLALIFGGIFAVAVILLFLRSIRSTIIVGIAIPFSVIATFVLMYFSGMSLNIMSLGGLALGVGMLVDNAIVVIENIYRHLANGSSRKEAAINGASEVGGAITASTLTTLAVFLPIVFVGGMVGDLFKELSLTVAFSLISSLIVALTVVPTLAGLLLKKEKVKKPREYKWYQSIIKWVLSHRLITLLVAGVILIGSLALTPRIGTEFMPTQDEGIYRVDVELPMGATFERTMEVIERLETVILEDSDTDLVTASIGNSDPMMAAVLGSGENEGSLTVTLVSGDERNRSTFEVVNDLEEVIADWNDEAEISVSVSNSMEAMAGAPNMIEIVLLGDSKEQLEEYSSELASRLSEYEEFKSVTDSVENGKPEFQYVVHKDEAFKYGLTSYQVASFINQSLQGQIAATIFDTQVRVSMSDISNSKEAIEELIISTPTGQQVQLKEIGEVVRGEGPVTVVRENQQDTIIVSGSFDGADMGSVMVNAQTAINEMIDDLNIDTERFTIKMAGGAEMMDESFAQLGIALILAIIFVYMVMASQFESLRQPFIIMFTLPLAITGVILGLLLTGYAFGITAFIGIIILVGIVVNNAIVFIDYTNQQRAKGLTVHEALVEAGKARLRPIIMTALTTMLGLLPLAIGVGEGTEMQAPMAIAVIGGLFTSTLLTLVVIPVIYSLMESRKEKKQMMKKKEA